MNVILKQVVPIPEEIESKVEESFITEAENNGLILSDYPVRIIYLLYIIK